MLDMDRTTDHSPAIIFMWKEVIWEFIVGLSEVRTSHYILLEFDGCEVSSM